MPNKTNKYIFEGFGSPNTTPVPDVFFDELMPRLSSSELRVLLYIMRRTFGFKKDSDNISLKQMVEGIRTREGRILDQGAGLSKPSAVSAVKGLVQKGVLLVQRNRSNSRGDEPTTYTLRFRDDPVLKNLTGGSKAALQGGVKKLNTQETVLQNTVQQHDGVAQQSRAGVEQGKIQPSQSQISPVAESLTSFGLSPAVSKQLAHRYGPERITQKLDYLAHLQKYAPKKIKSPGGWLRRAIEEDYAAPDGYKNPEQRRAEVQQTKQRRRSLQKAAAMAQTKIRPTLPWYDWIVLDRDISKNLTHLTKQLQQSLEHQLPAPTFNLWVSNLIVTKAEKGEVRIAVPSRAACNWLSPRYQATFEEALSALLKQPVEVRFEVVEQLVEVGQ